MLLSSIYPPGVYFQGVEGTALTRGRAWSPRSGTTEVWDTTWIGNERIVDVHIGNLHRKHGTDTRSRRAGPD